MNQNESTISIIVPNWNTRANIIRFLESLECQNYPKSNIEIVVVDNGSSDGSAEEIDRWIKYQGDVGWANLRCVRLGKNMGIAAGYNIGYENCSMNAWAVMRGESDVELTPNCLETMAKTLIDLPNVGVVGAKGVLFDKPHLVDHAARFINWWTGSLHDKFPDERTECDCIFGGTFLIRGDALRKINYFYNSSKFLASELELCTRIKKIGYSVVYEPKAVSLHKIGQSSGKMINWKFQYISMKEGILFQIEYNRIPYIAIFLCFSLMKSLWHFIKGDSIYLIALRDGLLLGLFKKERYLPKQDQRKAITISEWLENDKIILINRDRK